jgi:hypothetical protein
MSRHRASDTVSADYKMRESVYLEVAKKDKKEYYKLHQHEVDVMNTFMLSKNNSCIFSETNYDVNGKCLDQDEMGNDIPMSDGGLTPSLNLLNSVNPEMGIPSEALYAGNV